MADSPEVEAPAVEPDTPTPTPADIQPEVDYRQRYENLQPEYTRVTQTLSDEEKLLAHIQDKFPHWLDNEPEQELDPEPTVEAEAPTQDPRMDEVYEWMQSQQTQASTAAFEADLKELAGDRPVPKLVHDAIFIKTMNNGGNADALKEAADEWFGELDTLAPKKRPRAPHVPAGGDPPSEPDQPRTHDARTQRMLARIQAESV